MAYVVFWRGLSTVRRYMMVLRTVRMESEVMDVMVEVGGAWWEKDGVEGRGAELTVSKKRRSCCEMRSLQSAVWLERRSKTSRGNTSSQNSIWIKKHIRRYETQHSVKIRGNHCHGRTTNIHPEPERQIEKKKGHMTLASFSAIRYPVFISGFRSRGGKRLVPKFKGGGANTNPRWGTSIVKVGKANS